MTDASVPAEPPRAVLRHRDLPHVIVAVGRRPPPADFRAYLARHAGNSFSIESFQGLDDPRMPFPVPIDRVDFIGTASIDQARLDIEKLMMSRDMGLVDESMGMAA